MTVRSLVYGVALLLSCGSVSCFAQTTPVPSETTAAEKIHSTGLTVEGAYARATFPMAPTGAAYFSLTNSGSKPVTLRDVSISDTVAGEAQIHTTIMKNDMMRMVRITDGLTIESGATLSFEPGSYHIMLMGLKNGLEAGAAFELTLIFDDGTRLPVTVNVTAIGTEQEKSEHQHHHHH
ncbi:copper chaperone PCu(A)C [Alteromonas sp. CYL-A6]|uniref:copper chaperone PCu(A)C n=1 Tax=Alteromonas nitratireducens TaxID=3390813 RepID=UPI0034AC1900